MPRCPKSRGVTRFGELFLANIGLGSASLQRNAAVGALRPGLLAAVTDMIVFIAMIAVISTNLFQKQPAAYLTGNGIHYRVAHFYLLK
jgi:hypothetical protein